MTVLQDTITTTARAKWAAAQDDGNAPALTATPAALLSRWAAHVDDGADVFSLSEYVALIDLARDYPAIVDGAEVLDLASDEFGHALYAAAPWTCPTCGGARFVEAHNVVGSWFDDDGPQLDITDEPCPTCVADAGDWAVAV